MPALNNICGKLHIKRGLNAAIKLLIRRAGTFDARVIAEIMCSSWQSAYKDIILPKELARHTDIEARTALFERLIFTGTDNFLIAFDGDKPCGVCSFCLSRDPDMDGWGEIVAIYVIEDYWGKGVGRALMDAGISGLRELGCSHIMLWTLKANARARKFYKKYGFHVDGSEKDSGICGLREVRYRIVLN